MDSEHVEFLYESMRQQYPDLVRVLGEYRARTEVEMQLAHLVLNYVLDPVDAQEILNATIGGNNE